MALRNPRLLGQRTWLGTSGHKPAGPGSFGGHFPCPLIANAAATGIKSRSWGQGDLPSVQRNLSVGRKCRVPTQGCLGHPVGTCAQGPFADEASALHQERPALSLSHVIQLALAVKEGAITHPQDCQKARADNAHEEASPSHLASSRSLVDGCWDLLKPRGDVLAKVALPRTSRAGRTPGAPSPRWGPLACRACLLVGGFPNTQDSCSSRLDNVPRDAH